MELNYDSLLQISNEVGNNFYIFLRKKFICNIVRFRTAFKQRYNNVSLSHSFKTNYTPQLIQIAKSEGMYAEVVSELEYDMAIRAHYSPNKIVFNGPIKTGGALKNALINGSIVNLDHIEEVYKVCEISDSQKNKKFRIGIRCNVDIGSNSHSRFGLDEESGELTKAFKTLAAKKNIVIEGIHIHDSSLRTAKSYERRAKAAIEITHKYNNYLDLKYIDIGGGFPSILPEKLLNQIGITQTNYEEYAKIICKVIKSEYGKNKTSPELILEPGLALFADVFKFYSRVIGRKKVGKKNIAILSGSIHNIKPSGHDLNMPVTQITNRKMGNNLNYWDLTGYTCMEHDLLQKDFLGELEIGDFFVFDQVGAYTTVLKPPFIETAPPIIENGSGKISYLRQRETIEQMLASYEE